MRSLWTRAKPFKSSLQPTAKSCPISYKCSKLHVIHIKNIAVLGYCVIPSPEKKKTAFHDRYQVIVVMRKSHDRFH